MSNIVINDLEMNQDLDKHTAANITGGFLVFVARKVAFKAGYAIGKKADEKTGASDAISDKAIDVLGPAPKWLQSWF